MTSAIAKFSRSDPARRRANIRDWKYYIFRDMSRIQQLESELNSSSGPSRKRIAKDISKVRTSLRHYRYIVRKGEEIMSETINSISLVDTDDEEMDAAIEEAVSQPIMEVTESSSDRAEEVEIRLENGTTSYQTLDPAGALVSYQAVPRYVGPVVGSVLLAANIYCDVDPESYYLLPLKDGFFWKSTSKRICCFSAPRRRGYLQFTIVENELLISPPVGCYFSVGYHDSVYCFVVKMFSQ